MFTRSSPLEDYRWTLTGVSNLVEQQRQIVGQIIKTVEEGDTCNQTSGGKSNNDDGELNKQSLSKKIFDRKNEIEDWKYTSLVLDQRISRTISLNVNKYY